MNPIERIKAVFDFSTPDRLPQCNFFTDGFISLNGGLTKNLYIELGYEIVPLFSNLYPDITQSYQKPNEDGIFTDGWGRRCRKTETSGFIEVLGYSSFTLGTLPRFSWEAADSKYRFEKAVPDNFHHPRPFSEELKNHSSDVFLCGNVYDPFETLSRVIGLKNALMFLKSNPDELKPALERFGTYMTELGLAQINYGGSAKLKGIWIWGDIAYNRGLMMSPETYRELILPSLKKMCKAFMDENVKIIYHTDGNPREILNDLIDAGVDGLHPTEQVPGMELESLMNEYHGKLTFIGGIPPLKDKSAGFNGDIKQTVSKIVELGKSGGLIPGFTNFIPANFDINVLKSITNFFAENHYKQ